MLTLNTNAWWENIWNRVSNTFLWWYPDFKQILLKPSTQFSSSTNVWNVNWTTINNFCSRISEWRCFLWTSTASNYWNLWKFSQWYWWLLSTTDTEFEYQVIVSSLWNLSWWEIVWKEIWCTSKLTNSSSFNRAFVNGCVWKIIPWLLHTDWTITNIIELTDTTNVAKWWNYWCNFYWQWNWVVAQEWDKPIAKLYFKVKRRSTQTETQWASLTTTMEFWYDWSASWEPWTACTPIQVSID